MKVRGLSLFSRCSGRSLNIASYHSPHSLTWRWIVRASLPETWRPKFGYMNEATGPHRFLVLGLFPLAGFRAMKNNNGWQFGFTLLGLSLDFDQQHPMWYRDLYQREQNTRYERRAA